MTGFYMIEISVIEELRTSCINNNGLSIFCKIQNSYLGMFKFEHFEHFEKFLKKIFSMLYIPLYLHFIYENTLGQILGDCTEFV